MHRRASPRLLPLLGVVLYVFAWCGQLAATAHSSLPHVRCADHGELSHIAIDASDEAPIAPADHPTARPQERRHIGGHEHCPLAAVIDQSARPSRSAPPVMAIIEPARPARPVRRDVIATDPVGALLRAAPKTSPPAV